MSPIPHDVALAMLNTRLDADDPALLACEVVLLRDAFERLDDWLLWLDKHSATTHGGDPSTAVVLQTIGGMRHAIKRHLLAVDLALVHAADTVRE